MVVHWSETLLLIMLTHFQLSSFLLQQESHSQTLDCSFQIWDISRSDIDNRTVQSGNLIFKSDSSWCCASEYGK